MVKRGLAIYFFDDTIRIFEKTMEELQFPKYIHLFIDREKKLLYIKGSKARDNNTFRVSRRKESEEWRYRIYSKGFVKYLASLVGVAYPSDSLWFEEELMDGGNIVQVKLNEFHPIPYKTN